MIPRFSATNARPSAANRIVVGQVSPGEHRDVGEMGIGERPGGRDGGGLDDLGHGGDDDRGGRQEAGHGHAQGARD